jgi:hypothetical protein
MGRGQGAAEGSLTCTTPVPAVLSARRGCSWRLWLVGLIPVCIPEARHFDGMDPRLYHGYDPSVGYHLDGSSKRMDGSGAVGLPP